MDFDLEPDAFSLSLGENSLVAEFLMLAVGVASASMGSSPSPTPGTLNFCRFANENVLRGRAPMGVSELKSSSSTKFSSASNHSGSGSLSNGSY